MRSPADFSPAAARYVHRMAYDRKSYAASLVDMAVKGYLTIAQQSSGYTLTRSGKSEGECGLGHGETAIAAELLLAPSTNGNGVHSPTAKEMVMG